MMNKECGRCGCACAQSHGTHIGRVDLRVVFGTVHGLNRPLVCGFVECNDAQFRVEHCIVAKHVENGANAPVCGVRK